MIVVNCWRCHGRRRVQPSAVTVMSKINVLMVDDELAIIKLLTRILQREPNLALNAAANGAEAASLAKQKRFDAIICDVHLPDIDGLALIQKLKAENICPPLVMILSGSLKPPPETMPDNMLFINKPFDSSEIINPLVNYAKVLQPRGG